MVWVWCTCGVGMVYMWCGYGVHVVRVWCHVVRVWCTCGEVMVYMWGGYGVMWYGYGVHVVRVWCACGWVRCICALHCICEVRFSVHSRMVTIPRNLCKMLWLCSFAFCKDCMEESSPFCQQSVCVHVCSCVLLSTSYLVRVRIWYVCGIMYNVLYIIAL